jgi:hypothetical protein
VLWNCAQLIGLTVAAVDGDLGRLTDLRFDDERWVVRYLVIETDAWARSGQMLISPSGAGAADDDLIALDDDDIEDVDSVMALREMAVSEPEESTGRGQLEWRRDAALQEDDFHLKSVEEVRGYRVVTEDGDIGAVEGFIINEPNWTIDYVIVSAGTRKLVVVPAHIQRIEAHERQLRLAAPAGHVLAGPEFTEDIQEAYNAWLRGQLMAGSQQTH